MNEDLKKRTGYIRKRARKIIDDYFTKNPPKNIPIPIDIIAQYSGFEIYELETMDSKQRAIFYNLKEEKRKLIGLNKNYHIHNKRFSIGHELGHYFLGHPPESECTEEEIKLYNQEADEFSGELLIPLELLKQKIKEIKDPQKIATLFNVSEQALWIKIQNQGLIKLF
jgi:Zn-dependent peptidase ImmA (M78 family)